MTLRVSITLHLFINATMMQDGKSAGEMQSIQEVLDRLKRTTYALSELQVRPPPEGVDPTKLESYLTDDDFQVNVNQRPPLHRVCLC